MKASKTQSEPLRKKIEATREEHSQSQDPFAFDRTTKKNELNFVETKKKPHEPRKSEIFRNKPYKISQDSPYTIEISVQLTKNEKSILKKGFSYINCISASSILKHNQRCLVHFLGKLLLLP